jgi:hypothetical protein
MKVGVAKFLSLLNMGHSWHSILLLCCIIVFGLCLEGSQYEAEMVWVNLQKFYSGLS